MFRPAFHALRAVPRPPVRAISTSAVRTAEARPGPALSQTNRAEHTLRRFWKHAHVKEDPEGPGFLVTLDHRPLKSPAGTKLVLPKDRRLLAALIAHEWENQDQVLKQHALPLTSLASRAVDGFGAPGSPTREGVIDALMEYLETDTICFPGETPSALVRLQKEHWDPLVAWLKDTYGVTLGQTTGFGLPEHSEGARDKLRVVLEGMDAWELAAFERAVYATKSFVAALAFVKGRITADEAAHAAHVEVRAQIEQWGEVEDTHDVDYQDIRRSLGTVAMLLARV
ncbi:ATP12-domain-containing protein [Cutaneotrichosporon oleaginosum]|uniref:ATP12-domain-containing protein n=1 Tax=Cutaneotrichosporon oleaginosum TaxID=879819 RepID=A0A0J0XHK1_9TREE|nr:ATP12-domain-containing protein [Cutaneotrichosporon oleaginosum]KLT40605.1 ATP12-domain-containing protein [Cutaneotrichosporon oleaginosum]